MVHNRSGSVFQKRITNDLSAAESDVITEQSLLCEIHWKWGLFGRGRRGETCPTKRDHFLWHVFKVCYLVVLQISKRKEEKKSAVSA